MGTSKLKHAFSQMNSIPFPPGSAYEETSVLHAELVFYDTTVAGIITTLINGGHVPQEYEHLVQPELELRARLSAAAESKCSEMAADAERYLDYLDRLEQVVELAARELRTSMD
jgi:hypothetical protein